MEAFIGFSWIFHKPSSLDWVPLMDTPPSKRILPPRRSILLASRAPWKIPLRDSWTAAPRSISWNLRLAKKTYHLCKLHTSFLSAEFWDFFPEDFLDGWIMLNWRAMKMCRMALVAMRSLYSQFFFPGGFQAGGASRRGKTTHGFPLGEWSADGVVILVVWIAKELCTPHVVFRVPHPMFRVWPKA